MTDNDLTTRNSEHGRSSDHDGEPALVEQVLKIFREQLADVAFPDVSASILEAHASRLNDRRSAVTMAQAQLREAEGELERARCALVQLTQRAVAYAKIYAAGDPALQATLDGLGSTRVAHAKTKSRARRQQERKGDQRDEGAGQEERPPGSAVRTPPLRSSERVQHQSAPSP